MTLATMLGVVHLVVRTIGWCLTAENRKMWDKKMEANPLSLEISLGFGISDCERRTVISASVLRGL
jgi:hypothetical protein